MTPAGLDVFESVTPIRAVQMTDANAEDIAAVLQRLGYAARADVKFGIRRIVPARSGKTNSVIIAGGWVVLRRIDHEWIPRLERSDEFPLKFRSK